MRKSERDRDKDRQRQTDRETETYRERQRHRERRGGGLWVNGVLRESRECMSEGRKKKEAARRKEFMIQF